LTTVTHRNATLLAVGNGTAADDQEVARMPRTGYVYDPLMMLHCHDSYTPTPDTDQAGKDDLHPEEPMRIKRIYTRLRNNGLIRRMKQLSSKEASFEQVTLVHDEEHWMKIHGTESKYNVSSS
jgi:histone deacetylase 6